jgi:Cation transporter/ATPase, N-terminus/Cation transporting ATPase, C-terminus
LLVGDPLRPASPVHSREDVLRAIEQPALHEPGMLAIAPRVALVHSLAGSTGHLTLRWLQLATGSALLGERSTELAIVLTAPLGESGVAIRLVASLKACFRDATLVDRARDARTREDLVRILAPIEEAVGSSTLSADDVLALLGSTPSGLSDAEAVRRCRLAGPNRLEQIRRRPLSLRFLEQFTSFFAVLLWVGGAIAILVVFILVPPFPAIFGLAPLSFAEWSLLLVFPPTVLLLEEARKSIVRWRAR